MNFWSVFLTGLLTGGASCALVQGGLLAGVVARRREGDEAGGGELAPVGAFLVGKLTSHMALGALLGAIGDAAQLSFRARAYMQIGAGLVMILLAANLLGLSVARRLVPVTPPRLARLLRQRRSSPWAPAVLGLFTVLVPCGVTLSVMALAIASGSPVTGALGMGVFVAGTTPLFTVLGYAVRRSGQLLRGYLGKAAAVAVVIAGLVSINSGLVLSGSSFTLEGAWSDLTGRGDSAPAGSSTAVTVDPAGVQQIVIDVHSSSYSPARVRATAGLPTRLVLRTSGTGGCTLGFVIPKHNEQINLPETGETVVDLGTLASGRTEFTCSMGMYRGSIEAA